MAPDQGAGEWACPTPTWAGDARREAEGSACPTRTASGLRGGTGRRARPVRRIRQGRSSRWSRGGGRPGRSRDGVPRDRPGHRHHYQLRLWAPVGRRRELRGPREWRWSPTLRSRWGPPTPRTLRTPERPRPAAVLPAGSERVRQEPGGPEPAAMAPQVQPVPQMRPVPLVPQVLPMRPVPLVLQMRPLPLVPLVRQMQPVPLVPLVPQVRPRPPQATRRSWRLKAAPPFRKPDEVGAARVPLRPGRARELWLPTARTGVAGHPAEGSPAATRPAGRTVLETVPEEPPAQTIAERGRRDLAGPGRRELAGPRELGRRAGGRPGWSRDRPGPGERRRGGRPARTPAEDQAPAVAETQAAPASQLRWPGK
jgi:hypothetical protein